MEEETTKQLADISIRITALEKQVRKVNNYILYFQIIGVVKILLIVAPIILAIIYLPPYFKDFWAQYNSMLEAPNELRKIIPGL
ncbi:MAG: hypothetical protein WC480_02190 [Patescibacteria group bacterium]